ncbi:hypothetical protein KFK09_027197 [Dendrobium nobile]|uniref:BZIP domain-containing protein n=1 Tax=Dendrobium nobile TaxID=94219 RepID=A0A8T3AAE5_DENNO|nr:hypothetical protein KFK09_027197 [Dendrobium nobile]
MADQLPPNPPFNSPSFPSSPPSPFGFSPECYLWADKLFNFAAYTKASHRRAFSDSVIALEPPATANPTMSSAPPSDHNNVNEDNYKPNVNPPDCHAQPNQPIHFVHSEGEISSADDTLQLPIQDPKRVKRILANRQSARRSRERKLQYISELQKLVGKLETDVAALTPRVAFFDCQRSMLVMQNSQIKQRIAVLAQENFVRDGCYETLNKEIGRLSQLYQRQNLAQTDAMTAAIDAGGEDTASIFYQNDLQSNP